ncbi:hypothetical protein D3C85_135240 [compost metagenome]|jgi:hypothetical protein
MDKAPEERHIFSVDLIYAAPLELYVVIIYSFCYKYFASLKLLKKNSCPFEAAIFVILDYLIFIELHP